MKSTTSQLVKWATGFTLGVTVIMWVFTTFPTKEQQHEYIKEHEKWESEALKNIRDDVIDIKVDVREIRNAVVTKKAASVKINTNIYGISR